MGGLQHLGRAKNIRLLKRTRGVALIVALFFMILIFTLASGFFVLIPQEMNAARRQVVSNQGYYVADAGVTSALEWLQWAFNRPGGIDDEFNKIMDASGNGVLQETVDGSWSFRVEMQPDQFTFGNPAAGLRPNPIHAYTIDSVALLDGREVRRLRVLVKQQSFANFSWFTDTLPVQENQATNLVLSTDRTVTNGPFHTNTFVNLYNNYQTNPNPPLSQIAFRGPMSYVADPDLEGTRSGANYVNQVHYSDASKAPTEGGLWNFRSYQSEGRMRAREPIALTADTRYLGRIAYGEDSTGNDAPDYLTTQQEYDTNGEVIYTAKAAEPNLTRDHTSSLFQPTTVSGQRDGVQVHANPKGGNRELQNGFWFEGDVEQIELSVVDSEGDEIDPSNLVTNPYHVPGDPKSKEQTREVDLRGNQKVSVVQSLTDADGNSYQAKMDIYEVVDPSTPLDLNDIAGGTPKADDGTNLPSLVTATDDKPYTVVHNHETGRWDIMEGVGSGVYYVSGDINGIKGVIKGAKTFGTATDRGGIDVGETVTARREARISDSATYLKKRYDKRILINGDLIRADTLDREVPHNTAERRKFEGETNRDMLGLVGYQVLIAGNTDPPRVTGGNYGDGVGDSLELYASIYAGRRDDPAKRFDQYTQQAVGGGFGAQYLHDYGLGAVRVDTFGCVIEGIDLTEGYISGGRMRSGIELHTNWDRNLEHDNPPFFPSIADFTVVSWEDQRL